MSAPTVTQSEIPMSTGHSTDTPAERGAVAVNAQTTLIPVDIPITQRERLDNAIRGARTYFTPPAVLTERPASVAELTAYAKRAGWTSQSHGGIRAAGIAWYRVIGLPTTVVCRYVEWIAQRPGRAIPAFALWKLVISTGPGPWITDNVITPLGHAAAWVLL
jgi:hypothetical protein